MFIPCMKIQDPIPISVFDRMQSIMDRQTGPNQYEDLDGGVWNSLISKNLAHYSLSLKCLLIL